MSISPVAIEDSMAMFVVALLLQDFWGAVVRIWRVPNPMLIHFFLLMNRILKTDHSKFTVNMQDICPFDIAVNYFTLQCCKGRGLAELTALTAWRQEWFLEGSQFDPDISLPHNFAKVARLRDGNISFA